jgi:Uma2 family endonuclease
MSMQALPSQTVSSPTAAASRLYTAEDLLELSQHSTHRYELIQGKLRKMSPSGSEHGVLAARILSRLQLHVDEHELGLVFAAETGFRLEQNPDTVRAPDASYVRADRIAPAGIPATYFPGAPDLAVEIVSPHDTAAGIQDKVQSWPAHGTQLVWVVEPRSQTVTVYRVDGSAQVLQRADTLDGEDILPGFQIPLSYIFRKVQTR